jgi:hypothetical protein
MDIALLTRHRLWAWIVLACTPEVGSWKALDAHWLAEIDGGTGTQRPHRKVFQRYFYVGNDPGRLRGINGNRLIEVVHTHPLHGAAAALYTSPFWQLTASVAPTLDEVRAIHAELLRRLELVRLTPTERAVAINSGFDNVASDNRDLRTITENAYNVGELASVDALALLACSFRLALDALSLKEAEVYLDALRWSLRRFLIRWDAHPLVSRALMSLIEVRLLRRPTCPVSPELLGFRIRRDRRYVEPTFTSESRLHDIAVLVRDKIPYTSPIVPMDGDMETFFHDFEKNCRGLREQIVQRLSDGDKDSDWKENLSAIRQQRSELVDDVLLGRLNSPDEDAVESLRYISRFRALGGLASILDEFFNPKIDSATDTNQVEPNDDKISR